MDGERLVARVEGALEDVEALPGRARETAMDAVRALLDLYGEGLARVLEHTGAAGALAGDELVAHLLLLHGLHPEPVEDRVTRALDEVRPYLRSHGGDVALLEVRDGVARVRLDGSCHGCPSSAVTLKLAVEEAVARAAPDVDRVEAQDEREPAAATPAPALLQIEPLRPAAGAPQGAPRWTTVGALPELRGGGALVRDVAGEPALFLSVAGQLYAYRPACPGCGASLGDGELRDATLACPGCGHRFDVRRAGRCDDAPELHLDPLPLLVGDAGDVRLAVGA
ncbi:MAG TPA: NifU family protein [Solirubrobacteraceae bacterium]|nr:NifU family protein [Solirubrobacteraceae bacterium]